MQENENLLTWHHGTLKPYASLWHTVLRLAALNRLKLHELPIEKHDKRNPAYIVQSINILYNEYNFIDIGVLASLIGEPIEAFEWCNLTKVAPWMRYSIYHGIKTCSACLAAGYHTALYSLRLIEICPIHNINLKISCECGRPYNATISSSDLLRAGCCACERYTIFNQKEYRAPTLDINLIKCLLPVAVWVEQMSELVKSSNWYYREKKGLRRDDLSTLYFLSHAHDIQYPEQFIKPNQESNRIFCRYGGPFLIKKETDSEIQVKTRSSQYWVDSPRTWTYRAICRYLRRHVIRSDRFLSHTTAARHTPTTEHISSTNKRNNTLAITERMWASALETEVSSRRWPYRNPSKTDEFTYYYSTPNPTATLAWLEAASRPFERLSQGAKDWIEYQSSALTYMMLWRHCAVIVEELATGPNPTTISDIRDSMKAFDWAASEKQNQKIIFSSDETVLQQFQARPLPNKIARRAKLEDQLTKTNRHVSDTCSGTCLTWTEDEAWHVVPALKPKADNWKRHSLLGTKGVKLRFWIFKHDGVFVARVVSLPLQVTHSTSSGAIDLLRFCARQYAFKLGV